MPINLEETLYSHANIFNNIHLVRWGCGERSAYLFSSPLCSEVQCIQPELIL